MMEWYVFIGNFNSREIEKYNVFDHFSFLEDVKKAARKYRDKERDLFEEQLRKELMYYFWSKCEWEIVISHWPPSDRHRDLKTDAYDQVMLNWQPFCDYVWAHRAELRRREKKE